MRTTAFNDDRLKGAISPRTVFTYNGDFSGGVIVRRIGAAEHSTEVEVPFEHLKALVAVWLRDRHIAQLEQADVNEIFGVPPNAP